MSTFNKDLHIAVLIGGPGSEREISLVSGRAVAAALREAGCTHVTEVDVTSHEFTLPQGTQLAYIVIHGTFGEDGELQRRLEAMNIPYTGARSESSALSFDKAATKEILVQGGIRTPRSELIRPCEGLRRPSLPLPYVIKPTCEGSSVGVHIIHDEADIDAALEDAARHGDIIVEEFIKGRELTVGILDAEALPIVHIAPRSGFYDINNKYPWMNQQGGTDYFCPADLPDEVAAQVQRLALQAYRAAGVEVYGRVDVLLREEDMTPFVIEINTIPGMTPSSLLPRAAEAAGWTYAGLCERIAELSLELS